MKKKQLPNRIIVYDLETNGRSTVSDRILQVGLIVFDVVKQKVLYTYNSLVKIENNHVDYFLYHHTGWTQEYLNHYGRNLKDVVSDVYDILHEEPNTTIAGYNIRAFDNRFFLKYVRKYSLLPFKFEDKSFDTYLDYKADLLHFKKSNCPGNWKDIHDKIIVNHYNRKLMDEGHRMKFKDACDFYGISINENSQHHAPYDAELTFEMLRRQRPDWIRSKKPIAIHFDNLPPAITSFVSPVNSGPLVR